jgi:hypothetical protein
MATFSKNILARFPIIIAVMGSITTGLALLSYGYLGLFSRYYADDLCMSGLAVKRGFWQAQIEQYMTWSNRYAGMFALSVSDLLGTSFIRFWTALVLGIWVLILAWTLRQVTCFLKLSLSRWIVIFLAAWLVLFTLLISPQVYQSLFWRVGIITYILPLVFLSLIVGFIFNSINNVVFGHLPWWRVAAIALLSFFAGGFSETYITLQTGIFFLALLMIVVLVKDQSRRNWLILLGAGIGGSLLALLIVFLAPGNAARQALMPESPGILALMKMSALHTFLFVFRTLDKNAFQLLLVYLAPFLFIYLFYARNKIPYWQPSRIILILLAVPMFATLLIFAIMAPAAYAQSSYPDGRVLVDAAFIMIIMTIIEGMLTGIIFSQLHQRVNDPVPEYLQVITGCILIIILFYPLYDARKNILQIPEFSAQASSWDARDARIRAAHNLGKVDIQEKGLNAPGGLAEMREDPSDWVNVCATWFYDVNSISVGNP